MITSKYIIEISERYVSRPNVGNDSVEIFVNPNSQEIRDAAKDDFDRICNGSIRFFADDDKKEVYVWGSRILHHKLTNILKLGSNSGLSNLSAFFGIATVNGGRAKVVESYNLTWNISQAKMGSHDSIKFLTNFFSIDWGWLFPYIDCKDYLKSKLDEVLKLKKK